MKKYLFTVLVVSFLLIGCGAARQPVNIIVNDVNRAPILEPIPDQIINEGELLEFSVLATDPDGDTITLTVENIPDGATFNDNGDGTGDFSWTPDFGQSGIYSPEVVADDGIN